MDEKIMTKEDSNLSFQESFRNARQKRSRGKNFAPAKRERPAESPQTVASTKEEGDGVLMAPPKKQKPAAEAEEDPALSPGEDGVPNDFFEFDVKKREAETRKDVLNKQTDVEYARYQQEVQESLEQIAEEAAKDEQEIQDSFLVLEEREQQARFDLVDRLKQKRAERGVKDRTVEEKSAGLVVEEESDEEEESLEMVWRGRKLS